MLQSPNELGPRAALLQHYNVVKQHTEQSKSRVSCKGCSHTFAGKTTRMAAHYMQTAGESVSLCKSPPEGATDAATAHFSALEKKRVTTKKRKVGNDAIDSKQLSIWKMLDGKGHDSANAAFARMVFAHGLSFNIGTSKYLLDVMEEARKNPGWCPQGRIALSTTALDREYDKNNKHTKIQINELASIYGKTWQTDVMGGRHARLGADKANKLVFVRANLKLLANDYTKRPFIAWDPDSVESDSFLGSGEGVLVRNTSAF